MTAHNSHDAEPDQPSQHGSWEMLEAVCGCAATHVALLPTNKVFTYGGSSLDQEAFLSPPPAEILDLNLDPPATYQVSSDVLNGDIWCGGHTFLADGRLLFVGGTSYYPQAPDPLYGGLKQAYLFDPFTEAWERLDDMEEGRWYPTLIRLADDTVHVFSGLEHRDPSEEPAARSALKIVWDMLTKIGDRIVDLEEIFETDNHSWKTAPSKKELPLYPRLHLLPDGTIFYSGVYNTHFFVPGRYPSAKYIPDQGTWTELGGRHVVKNREEGISLLLALRPPDYKSSILIAGGGQHNLGRIVTSILHGIGKDSWAAKLGFLLKVYGSVERIDLDDPDPMWVLRGQMNSPRIHANGVLLPDGKVLVVGGMSAHGHIPGSHRPQFPVLEAEMYDPDTHRWTRMAAQQKARVYHSTAVLLPDARVISMGSNPASKMIEQSIEIFSPPYLHRGPRPSILACPDELTFGEPFDLEAEPAAEIRQVVLMRPEVVTHVTNTDQRLLELKFEAGEGDTLLVQGPATEAHMPRGYCMLFTLNEAGVPSVGQFVKLV